MIKVYVDGSCEPVNPGGVAAYGLVIYGDDLIIHKDQGVVGEGSKMSNNLAEYAALCAALSWLKPAYSLEHLSIFSDSQLLVNQMNKNWKAKKGLYLEYYREARKLSSNFRSIGFKWIPREQNTEADELSRTAYKKYLVDGKTTEFLLIKPKKEDLREYF